MRALTRVLTVVVSIVFWSTIAYAQASITGVVKDNTKCRTICSSSVIQRRYLSPFSTNSTCNTLSAVFISTPSTNMPATRAPLFPQKAG